MRSGRLLDLGLAALLAASLLASVVIDFDRDGNLTLAGRNLGPGCASRYVTGYECPFCGISHSFVALADGNLISSLSYHPLGPIVALLFVAFLIAVAVVSRNRTTPVVETGAFLAVSGGVLAASIVVWGARAFLG